MRQLMQTAPLGRGTEENEEVDGGKSEYGADGGQGEG